MSALSLVLRSVAGGGVSFWCPGCDKAHVISPAIWTWDGNVEAPTFSPSVLVTSGHYTPGHSGPDCWCTYNAKHPDDPTVFKCERCHSFVRAGRIEFLGDCTHRLAGQTVPLPPWPDEPASPAPVIGGEESER
jgi:hypothetical protein